MKILSLFYRVPGLLNDRRTMLGELNWIFTAITDTIAWNVLSRGKLGRCFCFRLKSCRLTNYTCTFSSNKNKNPELTSKYSMLITVEITECDLKIHVSTLI